MNRRRLYRCRHDQRLAGVAAGVAEYFDVDPSLVRVIWVLSIFAGGVGLLLYIAMAIIVPLEPEFMPEPGPWQPGSDRWGAPAQPAPTASESAAAEAPSGEGGTDTAAGTSAGQYGPPYASPSAGTSAGQYGPPYASPSAGTWATAPHRHAARGDGFGTTFFGIVLILFGAIALIDSVLPTWADRGTFLWPAFIVAVGVLLVVTSLRRRPNRL